MCFFNHLLLHLQAIRFYSNSFHCIKMARATELSKDEIIKILNLKTRGYNPKQISTVLGRSLSSIYRILQSGLTWRSKCRAGRPRKTSIREDRMMVKMSSLKSMSLRQIASSTGVSKNTVHRRIIASGYMKYKKMAHKPCLRKRHKVERLKWARKHMSYGEKWLSVIFSDEKKWNLDGPDGYKYYWHDLRKEPKSFFSRQQGGGSVMTWGGFGFNGQTFLAFTNKKMKSEDYQEILEDNLLPFIDFLGGPDCTFQQDGASIHTSRSTKRWFLRNNVNVLDWPAVSPDLNPVENMWGKLSRNVYENGKQYFSVSDLKTAILDAWYEIPPEFMQNLIFSIEERVYEVIKLHGNIIKY